MGTLQPAGLFHEIIELDEVDSTNRYALDEARPGLLVRARRQTSGRGRRGRSWFSPKGDNLYMTATLAPPRDHLPIIAGIAVRAAIARLIPCAAVALKWPNDIVVSGRKICGILCETRAGLTAVGMGINVNQSEWPEGLAHRAVSLRQIAGRVFDLDEIASMMAGDLSVWTETYDAQGFVPLRTEFLEHGLLKGYEVFDDRGRLCSIVDLTQDGHLVIESDGGRRSLVGESISIGWKDYP